MSAAQSDISFWRCALRSVCLLGVAASLAPLGRAEAQDHRVVFEGRPLHKVESSFTETETADLTPEESFEYSVRIVERAGQFYWASRDMRRLTRSESGAYITFHAVNGSGYVRIYIPMMLDLRERLPLETRRREIGYVEHLLAGFTSITYYGNRVAPARQP